MLGIYSGLSLQAQSEANARRDGITEIYGKDGKGGTARMQLEKDTAAARQGLEQNMANLRKDTEFGTASSLVNTSLAGSQLSNQLSLQAQDYRLQSSSLPFRTISGVASSLASLGGAALSGRLGYSGG